MTATTTATTDVLWQAENDHLAVTLYADSSADILDKARDTRWRMGRVALQEEGEVDLEHVWVRTGRSVCEQYPGRFSGAALHTNGAADGLIRFTLLGRERQPVGQFTAQFRLDGPALDVHILDVEDSIPSLCYPPPIESESLVLPMNVGRWVRQPIPERRVWVYVTHLNMRWFGGLRGDAGWLAIAHEGYQDGGALATQLAIAPLWFRSMGRWQGPRAMRYQFAGGGYVGLAKAFRAYAMQNGLFTSLAEKIDRLPAVGNLLGGRLLSIMQARPFHPDSYEDRMERAPGDGLAVSVTHREAARIVAEAQALGMKRGLVVLRGWIRGGYDESHPDIWPPEPALGSVDELRAALDVADPLIAGLHDNYQDIYPQNPSFPRGVVRTRGGRRLPGGMWAGGQAYILTARAGLEYASRNWAQIQTLKPRAMFPDTTTTARFYESYEPGEEQSRADDERLKIALLRFYRERGLMVGSEEGADFGVPYVDWFENRHERIPGQSIPLWPLVYHDAAYCLRYTESDAGLTEMLWGYPMFWGIGTFWSLSDGKSWAQIREAFAASGHVDEWHARIGADEMIDHRYLTEDGQVEETTFASGRIVVNFAAEARAVNGLSLPARGYVTFTE